MRSLLKNIFLWMCLGISLSYAGIWEVHFEGNQAFSDDLLIAQIGIPDEFGQMETVRREFVMRVARNSLEDFYYTQGYFSSVIELQVKTSGDSLTQYWFKIKDGVQYSFKGADLKFPPTARQLVETQTLVTQPGKPFRFDDILEDLAMIRTLYRRNGYLHLRVDHTETVDTTTHSVQVDFSIDPGHQVRMGNLKIRAFRSQGKEQNAQGLTDSTWLASLWETEHGQTIDGTYLTDFRSKLLGTQLFTQFVVEDTLNNDSTGLSDITIQATERIPGSTTLGAFFEQSYGFGFTGETRHRNLFGSFHEGSFSTMIAQHKQEAVLGYANPLFLGTAVHWIPTAIRFDNRIILSHEKLPLPTNPDSLVERYDAASQGALTFGLNSNIKSHTTVELRYIDKIVSRQLRMKGETGLLFNYTDNPVEPVSGWKISPTFGIGRSLLPTNDDKFHFSPAYPYVQIQSAIYLQIFGPLYGAIAYDFGHYFSEATDEDALAFYQGGSRSVRGYAFRSIFPRQVTITNGDTVVSAGLTPTYHRVSEELRLNLPGQSLRNFQVVQFLDWARVQDANSAYTRGQEMALGMGLRYHWQVLTLRLDYTFKKQFEDFGLEPYKFSRVTFDLSQAF